MIVIRSRHACPNKTIEQEQESGTSGCGGARTNGGSHSWWVFWGYTECVFGTKTQSAQKVYLKSHHSLLSGSLSLSHINLNVRVVIV